MVLSSPRDRGLIVEDGSVAMDAAGIIAAAGSKC